MACTHGTIEPASRFRVVQFLPHFARAGWQVSLRPNRPERPTPRIANPLARLLRDRSARRMRRHFRGRDVADAAAFDAVLVNRDLLGTDLVFERKLLAWNPRVVFDFDDAIFLGHKERHVAWMCRHAAWVTVGNEYLADFARRFTDRLTVLPTVVDVASYEPATIRPAGAPLRVGWCGSDLSIRETLFPHLEMLAALQRRLGFELVIMSKPKPKLPELGLHWRYVEWSPDGERLLARHMDVGLMPLVDDAFQRGKCGLKILQYMAAGLPAVASPVGVNPSIVEHGRTGFLAGSADEWHAALAALAGSAERRQEMGRAGRRACERSFSLERWFPVLLGVVERAAGTPVAEHTAEVSPPLEVRA